MLNFAVPATSSVQVEGDELGDNVGNVDGRSVGISVADAVGNCDG